MGIFSPFQRTLHRSISLEGIGVHSGQTAILELLPLAANMGIIFERTDLPHNNQIFASVENVVDTSFSTTVGNAHGVTLSTVEHLMAALAACQISNVLVRVSGPEMPIMDGSSDAFIHLIHQAGIQDQQAPRHVLIIKEHLEIKEEKRWIIFEPSDSYIFDLSIDFNGREGLAPESTQFSYTADAFVHDIAKARSFGFYEDAQKLYAAGLAKGSSLENAVVIKEGKVMNEGGLRYETEMVRHKVLDAMGDFYLSGYLIQGRCRGHNIGHEFNNRLMRTLLATRSAYEIAPLPSDAFHSALTPPLPQASSPSHATA